MSELAETLNDDHRRTWLAIERASRALRMSDVATLEEQALLVINFATRTGDDSRRLGGKCLVAWAKLHQRDFEAGRALAAESLAEARRLGLRDAEARTLNLLSALAAAQGDLLSRMATDHEGLLISRACGDRANEAIALANLGDGALQLGSLAQARQHLEAAVQLSRAVGQRLGEGVAHSALSAAVLWLGDAPAAARLAREALHIMTTARAPGFVVLAGVRLGAAQLALGELGSARSAFSESLARAEEINKPMKHDARAGLAQVALAEGNAAAALAVLQPLLEHVIAGGTLDGSEFPRLIELTCHQALACVDDARARGWLQRAHAALMTQADAITDPALRHGYLNNIPHHREIVRAWAGRLPEAALRRRP